MRERIGDVRRAVYRRQILEAAEAEFARSGYAATKVTAIARTAGVSLATVYKSFDGGKAEIWDALHAERMAALLAAVEATSRGEPAGIDRVLAAVAAVARFLAENDGYLDLSLRAGDGWAGGAESGHGVQATVWSDGLGALAAAVESALTPAQLAGMGPRVAAGLVVSAIQVWLADWVREGRARPIEEVLEALVMRLRWLLIGPE